jgi:hypothetical protein
MLILPIMCCIYYELFQYLCPVIKYIFWFLYMKVSKEFVCMLFCLFVTAVCVHIKVMEERAGAGGEKLKDLVHNGEFFKKQDNPGNGNCLFYALSNTGTVNIRHTVVAAWKKYFSLSDRPDIIAPQRYGGPAGTREVPMTDAEYLDFISKDGSWGCYDDIAVYAWYTKSTIFVHLIGSPTILKMGTGERISHVGFESRHYYKLIPFDNKEYPEPDRKKDFIMNGQTGSKSKIWKLEGPAANSHNAKARIENKALSEEPPNGEEPIDDEPDPPEDPSYKYEMEGKILVRSREVFTRNGEFCFTSDYFGTGTGCRLKREIEVGELVKCVKIGSFYFEKQWLKTTKEGKEWVDMGELSVIRSGLGHVNIAGTLYLISQDMQSLLDLKYSGIPIKDETRTLMRRMLLGKFVGLEGIFDFITTNIAVFEHRTKMTWLPIQTSVKHINWMESVLPRTLYDEFVMYKLKCDMGGKIKIDSIYYPGKMQYVKARGKLVIIDKNHKTDPVWDYDNDCFLDTKVKADKYHVTKYMGWHGCTPNQYYSVCNENLQPALSRFWKCRGIDEEHDLKCETNQAELCGDILYELRRRTSWMGWNKPKNLNGRYVGKVLTHVTNNLKGLLKEWGKQCDLWKLEPESFRSWYAKLPHVKKELRINYAEIFKQYCGTMDYSFQVEAKLKKEIAKYMKAPRLYVTYNEYGLFLPWMFEMLKKELTGLWDHNGERAASVLQEYSAVQLLKKEFVYKKQERKSYFRVLLYPDPEEILNAYRELLLVYTGGAGNCLYGLAFGDDSVIVMFVDGVGYLANMDISSCDTSCGSGLFKLTKKMIQEHCGEAYATGWYEQHKRPIRLCNPNDPRQSVMIRFRNITLGSGSTATTWIGTLGNMLIFDRLQNGFLNCTINDFAPFKSVANDAGFVVTLDICTHFEQVQFLKTSPYIVDDQVYYCKNFGQIFRGFGSIEGNLEPKHFNMSHNAFKEAVSSDEGHTLLVESFLGGIIEGWKNEPISPIVTALRERFPVNPSLKTNIECKNKIQSVPTFPAIPDEFFMNRYGCLKFEIDALVQSIAEMRVGLHDMSEAVLKFLKVDYGYEGEAKLLEYNVGNNTVL